MSYSVMRDPEEPPEYPDQTPGNPHPPAPEPE